MEFNLRICSLLRQFISAAADNLVKLSEAIILLVLLSVLIKIFVFYAYFDSPNPSSFQ